MYNKYALKELCEEAEKYGINIIMDVVANHLKRKYVGEFDKRLEADECWHEEQKISSYTDRFQITDGSLDGLNDLNTENELVSQLVYNYTQELKSLGVDGIRWDAAKHIALPSEGSDFWTIVTNNGLYNYGEILTGPTDDKNHDELMAEYTEYMSVTDSNYGNTLTKQFNKGKAPTLEGNWTGRGVTADKLVYWGESHDTYSNGDGSGAATSMEQNVIDRTYAITAAREGATSLYFSRPHETEKKKIKNGFVGSDHFTSPEVAAVNHFHNAMTGKKDCYAVTDNISVVTRENGGAVIVCGSGSGEVCVENAGGYVKPGEYLDEVSGNTFTVTEDTISGTVSECGIAVVYNSDFLGRVYADCEKDVKFYDTLDVVLHCFGTKSATYTLQKNLYSINEETEELDTTETTETAEFKDGDIITLESNGHFWATFYLTLNGTTENGRELSEFYKFSHALENRKKPDSFFSPGSIIFDNIFKNWEQVYIYAYDDLSGQTVTNGDLPGELMTKCEQGYYIYHPPKQFDGCNSIHLSFSNGKGEVIDKVADVDSYIDMIMSYNANGIYLYYNSFDTNFVGLIGDYYPDGKINTRDSLEVLRYTLNIGGYYTHRAIADANQDDNVNAKDSLLIQRYTLKLPSDEHIGTAYVRNDWYYFDD